MSKSSRAQISNRTDPTLTNSKRNQTIGVEEYVEKGRQHAVNCLTY